MVMDQGSNSSSSRAAVKVGRENLSVLAWELVACAQRPPLHPTTCAVLRVLWVLGRVSFREMCLVVPCAPETVRQQLNRMVGIGVCRREYVRHMGRKAESMYWLTEEGLRMVGMWQYAAEDMRQKLVRMLELRNGGGCV